MKICHYIANSILCFFIFQQCSVYSRPTEYNDVMPLDDDLPIEFIVQCELEGKVIMDELTLKNSPYLKSILLMDSTIRTVIIPGHGCYQNTLDLMTAFIKGDVSIWTHMNVFNAQDLMILADFVELQVLLDQCMVWILREMFLNGFQLSKQWKKSYPEHDDEMNALFRLIRAKEDIYLGDHSFLKVIVNGNEFFEKIGKVKRFSGLQVLVKGMIPNSDAKSMPNKSLRVRILEFPYNDRSEFAFLANGVSFPLLKRLLLVSAHISDLTTLSIALNHQKLPQLEELNLSDNLWYNSVSERLERLQMNTFKLENKILLKRLDLSNSGLTDISQLMNAMNYMPYLEELDLSRNLIIDFNTFQLKKGVALKILNLAACELHNVSFLDTVLSKMPLLEELNLSWNENTQWDTVTLYHGMRLKRLKLRFCELTDMSFLARMLKNMPQLEELDLAGNSNILPSSFQLKNKIPLKYLNLKRCNLMGLSSMASILKKMPLLRRLNLSRNNGLDLGSLHLIEAMPLQSLMLDHCGLTDISHLAHLLTKMPQLEKLSLRNNPNLQLETFQLQNRTYLKVWNLAQCGLSDISSLAHMLNEMPFLEELDLSENALDLTSFSLAREIPLKRLGLSRCGLSDVSTLSRILEKMPRLEDLHLSRNENIQLDSLQVHHPIPLKLLNLLFCGLTDTCLAHVLGKMPRLKILNY